MSEKYGKRPETSALILLRYWVTQSEEKTRDRESGQSERES